ncbi:PIN domain-containing protein [Paenibacillus mucilaginosus]|uniref:PIN domain-containing protein n=1 Tax=Paenibacillus mucilaginosus TaxID=61624 RepID=UPI003D224F80
MTGALIDTNIFIKLIDGEQAVIDGIRTLNSEGHRLHVSAVTIAEAFSGAINEKIQEQIEKLTKIEGMVLAVDYQVASLAGHLRRSERLRSKNPRNVKTPDALIIATAIKNDMLLVTNDKGMWFAKEIGVNVRSFGVT